MNIYVLLAKHTPNTEGFPPDWPVETRGEPAPSPWVEMTPAEYSALISSQAEAKDQWNQNQRSVLVVPSSVTPRQIRRALTVAGLRETVEAAVAAADQGTKDDWEFANEVRRDWPALNQMATALGMTSEQVDALFIAASQF